MKPSAKQHSCGSPQAGAVLPLTRWCCCLVPLKPAFLPVLLLLEAALSFQWLQCRAQWGL